jgi:protein-S-isoprenylcysteine O-methyltransferase Ste14
MNALDALTFALTAFAIVGAIIYGLVTKLRTERQQQTPGARTPIWIVILAAALAYLALAGVSAAAGWSILSPFRFALGAIVIVTIIAARKRTNATRSDLTHK